MEKPMHKLGELLMQAGLIDEIQLRSALGHQKRWGGKLGKALVDQGFIDEEVMLKFLAERFKMKAVNLIRSRIAPQTFEMVPENVAKKYEVVPVVVTGSGNKKTIVLAMSDPSDLRAIDEVQFLTAAKVEPVLATDSAISKVLQHYGDFTPEMVRELQYEKTAKPMELKAQAPKPAAKPQPQQRTAPQPRSAQPRASSDEGIDLRSADDVEVVKGEVTMIKAVRPQPKAPPPRQEPTAQRPRAGAPTPPAGQPARSPVRGDDDDSLFLMRPERGPEAAREPGKKAPAKPDAFQAPPLDLGATTPPPITKAAASAPAPPAKPEPPPVEAPKPPTFFVAPTNGEQGISDASAPPAVPEIEPAEAAPPTPTAPAEESDEIEPIELPEEEPGEIELADAHEFIPPQSASFAPPPSPDAGDKLELAEAHEFLSPQSSPPPAADAGEKLELADAHEFLSPVQQEPSSVPPWEKEEAAGPPPIDDAGPPQLSDEFLSAPEPSQEPGAPAPPPLEDIAPPSPVAEPKLLDLPPLIPESQESTGGDEDFWGSPPNPEQEEVPRIKIEPAAREQEGDAWGGDVESAPAPSPEQPPPSAAPTVDVWGQGSEPPADDIWGDSAPPAPAGPEPAIPDLPPLPDLEPAGAESAAPPEKPAAPPPVEEKPEDDYFEAAAPESDQELEYGIDRSDHAPEPGKSGPGKVAFLSFEGPPPDLEGAEAPPPGDNAAPVPGPPPPLGPEPGTSGGMEDEGTDDLEKIFQPGAMEEAPLPPPHPAPPASDMEISILDNVDSSSAPDLGALPELDLKPVSAAPPPAADQPASPEPPSPEPPPATAPGAPAGEEMPQAAGDMKQVKVAPDESPESLAAEDEIRRLMDLGDEFLDTKEVKKRLAQLATLENEVKHREFQFDELLNLMMRKELGEITQELFMKELQVLKKKADAAKKGSGKK